jgi:NAD(P) transhydrogenase subunit alpha
VHEAVSVESLALANQFLKLFVFVLAGFVGFLVITRVPPLLHTPLMSATNAISAISIVGALVAAGRDHNQLSTILGFIAVICATINVVGGFIITDRMLRMFKHEEKKK